MPCFTRSDRIAIVFLVFVSSRCNVCAIEESEKASEEFHMHSIFFFSGRKTWLLPS